LAEGQLSKIKLELESPVGNTLPVEGKKRENGSEAQNAEPNDGRIQVRYPGSPIPTVHHDFRSELNVSQVRDF